MSASILSDNKHLPEVGLGLDVALESVCVSTLFLTDLAVPSESLKPLGLHLVGEVFGCPNWELSCELGTRKMRDGPAFSSRHDVLQEV